MRKISLLHPSRSRPQKSYNTIQKWIERAGTDVEVVVSIDKSDNTEEYAQIYNKTFCGGVIRMGMKGHSFYGIINDNRSAVDAINNAAKHATGDIFIVVSDDTDCPLGWAVDLLKHLEGKEDFIVKVWDGIQPWIITMPIIDRKYYERFGYVYYPEYLHMFCDTELSCVADITGRRITIPMEFKHLHYSTGVAEKDQVSVKADATWEQGENLFIERVKINFGLVITQLGMGITDKAMSNWIKSKLGLVR